MLSGDYLPAHTHPFRDELLSSWLVRLAHANGLKVQPFCDLIFGHEHQLWNRDIDRLAPSWLMDMMSAKAGVPLRRTWETTLLGYEGSVYSRRPKSGQLRWILPLQIFHRKRLGHGVQFCPSCLSEDVDPFYRRSWRVAFYTFCSRHNVMLFDRCPDCGSGVAFHRLELGRPEMFEAGSLASCWNCGFDFRQSPAIQVKWWDVQLFQTWRNYLRWIDCGPRSVLSIDKSKLSVLHHFCTLMISTRLAPKLQSYLATKAHQEVIPLGDRRVFFEFYSVGERHHILCLAWWLLNQWPDRLRKAWQSGAVRFNVLLKDFDSAPAWYLDEASSYNRRLRPR